MSDYAWFTGTLVFTIFLIVLLVDMSVYNAEINCPTDVTVLHQQFNQSNYVGGTITMLGLFVSPCAGLDWWVYALLLILVIGDIVFLTPFIGD